MTENYVRIAEAAKHFKIKPSGIYWRIKHGRIATKTVDGKRLVLLPDGSPKRTYNKKKPIISMPMTASVGESTIKSTDTMVVIIANRANIKSLLTELME